MTQYGYPSDDIHVCEYNGVIVAFLPRHGSKHNIAPHKVPYKANLAALQEIGVRSVLATCIVGSLKQEIAPGSFVVPDQFVNLTWGRDDYVETDDGKFVHLPMAEPYCHVMRNSIVDSTKSLEHQLFDVGTVAVIQGPRFSTKAESHFYIRNGWDIVNMTQYPECYLARELGLCYGALASVTDYDVGVESGLTMESNHMDKVLVIFRENIKKTKEVIFRFLDLNSSRISCSCSCVSTETYYEQK